MADVLSQSEVESLLTALTPAAPQTGSADGGRGQSRQPVGGHEVRDAGPRQAHPLQAVHLGFSRDFAAALSNMVRTPVELSLLGVDEMTYGDFVSGLEQPTFLNVLKGESLEGHFIIELNPAIVFPIIDRLLGGGRAPGQTVLRRPFTEIELRLASRTTELATGVLRKAWSGLCELVLRSGQVECPQLVPLVPAGESLTIASFEISMGEARGMMNFGMPSRIARSLTGKLTAGARSAAARLSADRRQTENTESGPVAGAEMVVYLAGTKLTAEELAGLAVGDIIPTGQSAGGPLEVWIDGRPTHEGSPGLVRAHKAVRIGKPVVPPGSAPSS
jgi:flagellar motor switch protein FliM